MSLTIPNVPGVQFSKIKPYQHRQKEYHSTGYSGHLTDGGHIHVRKGYYTMIKVSRAWRIGFKNVSNTPIDIMMHFSVHDKYGALENFAQIYRNLRPGEPAEIFFEVQDKKANILFERVEVYANDQLLSNTGVKQFMPRMPWGLKSWAVALIMAIFSALALTEPQPVNFAAVILPFLALAIMGAGLLHRTAVMLMLLFLSLVPFTSHGLEMKITITIMGLAWLYWVWIKRHSVKDFLLASATPRLK